MGPQADLTVPRAGRLGAQAPSAIGRGGAVDHGLEITAISAVPADWERRFGARLVMAGSDTLVLTAAVEIARKETALRVAAEHSALCPDSVWQGPGSPDSYAESLPGGASWGFWWD
jgi:hypothetical protein